MAGSVYAFGASMGPSWELAGAEATVIRYEGALDTAQHNISTTSGISPGCIDMILGFSGIETDSNGEQSCPKPDDVPTAYRGMLYDYASLRTGLLDAQARVEEAKVEQQAILEDAAIFAVLAGGIVGIALTTANGAQGNRRE